MKDEFYRVFMRINLELSIELLVVSVALILIRIHD